MNAHDGWSMMLRQVMQQSGMQMVRIEKPGVGDSEGPSCAQADLDDDMAAFRAGIRAALADPGADPARLYLFGGSVGGALAPVLASEFDVRGIVVLWPLHAYCGSSTCWRSSGGASRCRDNRPMR